MAKTDTKRRQGKGKAPEDSEPGEALWRRIVETVKPLDARRRATAKPTEVSAPSPPTPEAPPPRATLPRKPAAAKKPPLPELTPRSTADVDKRTAQRLARGQLTIDAKLDLHGMTQAQAHDRLASFIRGSAAAGRRCVLVITGKGYRPPHNEMGGETGVLRTAVPRWLNEPGMRRHIVALRQAQPQHGGEGALYLLLRRDRDRA